MGPYTDKDFAGLGDIADAGLAKAAAEYGNLPEISTGNVVADMGLYFIPGVGTAMTAMDAARNYADTVSDLKRGKYLAAAGNLGSGILNTGLAGLDFLTLGLGGRIVGGALKAIGRGGKALSRGGKAVARAGQAGTRIGKGVGRADRIYNMGRRVALADRRLQNAGAAWARSNGGWIGRNMVKRPGRTGLAMGGAMAGTSALSAVGDARYDANRENWRQNRFSTMYDAASRQVPSYHPFTSFQPGKEYWES